ncbi:VOC family protein [Novosphingobium sp. KCTC 2891]|uniref:VOC family protein n=1 Tax=Novosphingobium sp. KCTC 2891 TaxID=2989730 RepID=UPI002223560B|nr:VOC family protein [Novosphingobium sp. KCTC 2891]MCW1384906.1 VOC family protein [Novosphingobium sp. KCTC 2891]
MSEVTELGYVTIGVSDLAAWDQFAAQVLGLEVVPGEDAGTRYLRMDYWHHRITLVEDGADDLMALGLRVAGVLEFREIARRLDAASVPYRIGTPAEAEARKVLEILFLEDPNGYPIELFHGPLVQYDLPFHPGRRMHGGFKTAGGGFGHMMLNRRAEFEAIHAFYALLGLRGGVEYKIMLPGAPGPVELMFLHCNQRQHTLAFGQPAEKRINHLMFEVEQMQDVGLAYDVVRHSGIPVIIEPGSHANDQMYSFYFKNPSGFMNEIGWGGREPTGQSEYYQRDAFGHAPVMENMKGFMIPA